MPCYPHTKIFHLSDRIVLLSGPHIQLLNTHGHVVYSTANFAREDLEAIIQSGPIRCAATSQDTRYLATTGDDKQLKIWDLESLTLLSARTLPKKPTSIVFLKSTDVLVSDKFGDVFRYPLHSSSAEAREKHANNSPASHENPSNGELVLGHTSLLTSCLLTLDEKFIITADRDEHIRISWYPDGYVIESYCLGHTKYVSAIHIPAASPTRLISGGGDPEIKVWDWITGRLLRDIHVFAAVEPFIKVRPDSRRRSSSGEQDNDDDSKSSRRERKRAGRAKQSDDANPELEDVEVHIHSENANDVLDITPPALVVHQISSFFSQGEHHIVFSAVGATSIFEFILDEGDDQLEIRHRDFGKPVIDFTISGDGTIWILVDASFSETVDLDDATDQCPCRSVYAVRWTSDQFVDDDRHSPILGSFHTTCMVSATAAGLKALDLYADLTSLPKSIDVESGTSSSQALGTEQRSIDTSTNLRTPSSDTSAVDLSVATTSTAGPGMTKRALGRLKHKHALDQLSQEARITEDKHGAICDAGPEVKKLKADTNEGS